MMFKHLGLGSLLIVLPAFAQESSQKILVNNVYIKAVPSPRPDTACLHFQDRIIRAPEVPQVRIDSEGVFIEFEMPLTITEMPCYVLEHALDRKLFRNLETPSDGRPSSAVLRVRPPFSEIVFADSSRLLIEAPVSELEDKKIFAFFERSIIRGALGAVLNTPRQAPLFWGQFEAPIPLGSRLSFSLALGQDFFDMLGSNVSQSLLDALLGFSIYGDPYGYLPHVRIHAAYEGRHFDDRNPTPLYSIGATRMLGVGAETQQPFGAKLLVKVGGEWLMSKSNVSETRKLRWNAGVASKLSVRWGLEVNYRASRLSSTSSLPSLSSTRTDHTVYLGFRLNPFADTWKNTPAL